jgi:hypothetical protein
MKWIVQSNLFDEAGYVHFIEALERLGFEYEVVKPVPFTNILLPADFDSATQRIEDVEPPVIDNSQKVIAMGATSMTRIAKNLGWNPGTYHNENFDYEVWRDGFGKENVLNPDGIVGRVCDYFDLSEFDDNVFVRPVHDTKTFSGEVMTKDQFHDWKQSISFVDQQLSSEMKEEGVEILDRDTVIVVASAKKIYKEYRFFVVHGKIVTGSAYKFGTLVKSDPNVEKYIEDFAYAMVHGYGGNILCAPPKDSPAEAYVIDIADTPDGPKVIEINCINSAGYYAADVQKIIMALEDINLG